MGYAGQGPPAVVYRYSPDRRGRASACASGRVPWLPAGRRLFGLRAALQDRERATRHRERGRLLGARAAPVLRYSCRQQCADRRRDAATDRSIVRHRACRHGTVARTATAASTKLGTPLIDDLAAFLDASLATISGRSDLAKAIRYARSRWTALTRYLDDGTLEISNNAAERAIRPLVVGRKNYLFAGSDAGGARAAAAYTLIETAKLNGLDPEAYLHEVLGRLADHPINRIAELLPWNIVMGGSLRVAA
jgi:hypothetical protein